MGDTPYSGHSGSVSGSRLDGLMTASLVTDLVPRSMSESDLHVSWRMRRIGRRDTAPERVLKVALRLEGMRYRSQSLVAGVRTDVILPNLKVAVFIHGCFWHGCPAHYSRPTRHRRFWARKIDSNRRRDRRQALQLRRVGWAVATVWEHDLSRPDSPKCCTVVRRLCRLHGDRQTVASSKP